MGILRTNAEVVQEAFRGYPLLTPVVPQGAMYAMVGINMSRFNPSDFADDASFAAKLLQEENLFVLPGKCFNCDNFIRLVMCCPEETIRDACARMKAFCDRYAR